MSSILKALRKLEEEKRGQKAEAPDIRFDQGQLKPRSKPLLSLFAGVLLGVFMVVVFLLLPGNRTPEERITGSIEEPKPAAPIDVPAATTNTVAEQKPLVAKKTDREAIAKGTEPSEDKVVAQPSSSQSKTAKPPTQTVNLTVAPPQEVPQARREIKPSGEPETAAESKSLQSAPVSPEQKVVTQSSSSQGKIVTPTSQSVNQIVAPPQEVSQVRREIKPLAETETTAESKSLQSAPVPDNPISASEKLPIGVDLSVSEIFYSEDPNNSMAVVNDLPVMIGSHVETAEVKEILADSVRFDIQGVIYTVPLAVP